MTGVATSREAYKLDVEAVQKAADPNRKYRWLVPLVFAAQIALKVIFEGPSLRNATCLSLAKFPDVSAERPMFG